MECAVDKGAKQCSVTRLRRSAGPGAGPGGGSPFPGMEIGSFCEYPLWSNVLDNTGKGGACQGVASTGLAAAHWGRGGGGRGGGPPLEGAPYWGAVARRRGPYSIFTGRETPDYPILSLRMLLGNKQAALPSIHASGHVHPCWLVRLDSKQVICKGAHDVEYLNGPSMRSR